MARSRREVEQLDAALKGKHVPSCLDTLTPLGDCICGGPERYMLLETYLDRDFVVESLVTRAYFVR